MLLVFWLVLLFI